ncbi:MAG: transcriptional regulator [Alphaproteobacteria bacterium]|nr:transcriptional regulator [Alphaproteobacteria bacterium]
MSEPRHHASDALLVAYAAGSLDERLAMVVATHLALCSACRAGNATLDAVGGSLLEALAPTAVAGDALGRVLVRLDDDVPSPPRRVAAESWPEPFASALSQGDPITWRRIGLGLRHHVIDRGDGGRGTTLRLLNAAPGAAVPPHEHGGLELTLVLYGAYRDGSDVFRVGDLQEVDEGVKHRPRALPSEACVCLVANERPLRLTRRIDRLMRTILRI